MDIALNIAGSEEEFIRALVRGDRAAQRDLYERYYSPLQVVCLRYTSNEDEATDVLHECFLKIYRKIGKYQSGTSLLAWMRRIAVNTAIDHYRRNTRRRTEDLETAYQVCSSDPDAISQYSETEILKAVQALSPTYRAVFNLYVIEGFSHREIGEKLGITESTSRSNLVKARGKLQQFLKGYARN
ncbi:MAG: RNA polymerase sigma factor [Saprospiraceae bacterium]